MDSGFSTSIVYLSITLSLSLSRKEGHTLITRSVGKGACLLDNDPTQISSDSFPSFRDISILP